MVLSISSWPFSHPVFFLLIVSLLIKTSFSALCNKEEGAALVKFIQSFTIQRHASSNPDAYPKTDKWNDQDCCLWDGVECDQKTGHVIGLDLSSSCLYGSIDSNSSLFGLVQLQRLNLGDNNFNFSEIPSQIGHLSRLSVLDLSNSAFYGQIPSEITKLSNLTTLDLGHNVDQLNNGLLQLKKPDFFMLLQTLTRIEILNLTHVSISSTLPDILALPSMTYLNCYGCGLFGTIPSSLGNLTKLQHINFQANNFSGHIPSSLGNLAELSYLGMGGNNLTGEIPEGLANLTQLEVLCLFRNSLTAGDLSWMGKLKKLRELLMYDLNLNIVIPFSFSNLTHLQKLVFHHNQLNGDIPVWISNLTDLVVLELEKNQMIGPIPKSIFELANLDNLNLGYNQFSGNVELDMFANLKQLTLLQLSGNRLTLLTKTNNKTTFVQKFNFVGLAECNLNEFPPFLEFQDELFALELYGNNIRGQVPKWIGNVGTETLITLGLGSNSLTGFEDPTVLSSFTNLEILYLDDNQLSGSIPVLPPLLRDFGASHNHLTGEIFPSLCDLESLAFLDLSNDNLTGSIPTCLGNLNESLLALNLANNLFSSNIPESFASLSSLQILDLSHNQLEGTLPGKLVDCQDLEFINLGENRIIGEFPVWFGKLPKLEVLILRSNQFSGEIGTRQIQGRSKFSKLRILDLSGNNFTGTLPNELFLNLSSMRFFKVGHLDYLSSTHSQYLSGNSLTMFYDSVLVLANKGVYLKYGGIPNVLAAIDLSSNKFQGNIPISIGTLKMVNVLNLSNNRFSGGIPTALCNLSNLESLDLSRNGLSGEIPQQLSQLNFLEFFNVSHNQLVGPIPQGNQFNTFENNSFDGNLGLCGKPLTNTCAPPPPPPPRAEKGEGSDLFTEWEMVLMGYGCGVVFGLVVGFWIATIKLDWFMRTFRIRQGQLRRRRAPRRSRRGTIGRV